MKPKFSDLTPEQQATFGNGCSFVPDFCFGEVCKKHDWFYGIGCGANYWYENLWKGPYHKLGEDLRMLYYNMLVSLKYKKIFLRPLLILLSVAFYFGLTLLPFSWFFFTYGPWKTVEEVVQNDQEKKHRLIKRISQNIL